MASIGWDKIILDERKVTFTLQIECIMSMYTVLQSLFK
jgi:hypothetical protein